MECVCVVFFSSFLSFFFLFIFTEFNIIAFSRFLVFTRICELLSHVFCVSNADHMVHLLMTFRKNLIRLCKSCIYQPRKDQRSVSGGIPFIMIDGCRQPGCHLSFLLLLFFRNDHDDVKQGDDVCAVCTHRPYCRPSEREREGKRRQANCIFSYSLSLSFIERKGEKRVCSL